MSRRKKPRKQTETQKQQQILQKIHVEIPVDYELLAKEILKQQELLKKAKEYVKAEQSDEPQKKISLWEAVWGILQNTRDTQGKILSDSMATFMSIFFHLIGKMFMLASIGFLIITIMIPLAWEWNTIGLWLDNLSYISLLVVVIVFCFLFGIIMIGSANDIERETDRDYIANVFSGLFGFVSLIVAIVALFKEFNP